MLIKWIRCQVAPTDRERFAASQARWGDLARLTGFLGQAGGWNTQRPTEACIVAFWASLDAYRNFMQNHHDPIYAQTRQQHTYRDISVRLYDGCPAMEKSTGPLAMAPCSTVLRQYPVMLVAQSPEPCWLRTADTLLLASGKGLSDADGHIHLYVAAADEPKFPPAATRFTLETEWLVVPLAD